MLLLFDFYTGLGANLDSIHADLKLRTGSQKENIPHEDGSRQPELDLGW